MAHVIVLFLVIKNHRYFHLHYFLQENEDDGTLLPHQKKRGGINNRRTSSFDILLGNQLVLHDSSSDDACEAVTPEDIDDQYVGLIKIGRNNTITVNLN